MRTIVLALGAMFLVIGAVACFTPASESQTIQEPQAYTRTEDDLVIQMVLERSEVYFSNISAADNRIGFWLDLNLFARAPVRVRIYGDGTPPIFDVQGWGFHDRIPLTNSTKWYVEITAGEFGGSTAVSGNIYARHVVSYVYSVLKSRTVYPYRNFGVGSISVGIFWIAGEYFLNRKKLATLSNRLRQLSFDLRQLGFSLLECSIARIVRLGKLKRAAFKFALVLFLLIANVAVAPFSCYITDTNSYYYSQRSFCARILSPTLIVIVLMLNAMCILTIVHPTEILFSVESAYYTRQTRKTKFCGIAGLYYHDVVMKQWFREKASAC